MMEVDMIGGHDIAMVLRAAYWAMHREADALLQPHRVTANQFVLMSILAEGKVLTQQELVRRASSDANTVRAMLVRLEHSGLVSRLPHQTDGRARCVSLTDKGRRTYLALRTKSRGFHERLLTAIGRDTASALVQQLRSLENMTTAKPDRHDAGKACRK
jgi:DNA-binding MarR family transcriptional regulator